MATKKAAKKVVRFKPKPLPSSLKKPMRLDPPPTELAQLLDPEALPKWRGNDMVDRMVGKTKAWAELFKHYGIEKPTTGFDAIPYVVPDTDNNPWKAIAIALAYDYIPGVRAEYEYAKKPRNTGKWTPRKQLKLVFAVEGLLKSNRKDAAGRNAREACRYLARKHGEAFGFTNQTNLYQRYLEAKKSPFVELWKLVAEHIEDASELADFRARTEERIQDDNPIRQWPRDISTNKPV